MKATLKLDFDTRKAEVIEQPESKPPVRSTDGLECQRCGHKSNPEIAWLGNCGVPWKVVVWCKVCKAAADGKTRQEAEKRFTEGAYEIEAR